ncbi:hypothetical protein QJS04_geneDACA011488 [Acorus gramineus]|uniref:Aminotransferase-like plant mobile domain-containing protein n=1 Tax=Acorus gramineus TaxID=55184 RepID=A0AAV9A2Z6_ACOGR|nr:hypothetical protein QJS04_geneDACA011488 [Acorus gramineus]
MTITLQDVAILTGLPIDGKPVTGITDHDDWASVCEELLGVGPPADKIKGGKIFLSWLKETFSIVPDVELDDDILQQYARAYILFVLGSTIFADGTGNKIHACYLHLFRDFEDAGRYSWGAAALAHLYRALYRGSVLGERMSAGSHGFYSLLQVICKI